MAICSHENTTFFMSVQTHHYSRTSSSRNQSESYGAVNVAVKYPRTSVAIVRRSQTVVSPMRLKSGNISDTLVR